MKFLMTMFILSASIAGVPELKKVPVDNIYVPKGFDSNDNAQIVVSGVLPNLCHKSPRTEIKVKGRELHIKVESLYYSKSSPFCPEMVVPFTKTVSLGVLNKGTYKIIVNESSRKNLSERINIAQAVGNKIDEFQYASVAEVGLDDSEEVIELKGYNPSDCFVLDSISYISNGKDTYSILPKMKQVSDFCPMKMVKFNYQMKLPRTIKAEKVLLHVRTLNGDSINRLVRVK